MIDCESVSCHGMNGGVELRVGVAALQEPRLHHDFRKYIVIHQIIVGIELKLKLVSTVANP